MNRFFYRFLSGGVVALSFFLFFHPARANAAQTYVFLDQKTVQKGFTAEADNGNFRLGIRDLVLTSAATVSVQTQTGDQTINIPADKQLVSPVYVYSVLHQGKSILDKPLWFFIRYKKSSKRRVGLYVWDRSQQAWLRVPATVDEKEGVIKGATHLSYAQMAVFGEDNFIQKVAGSRAAVGMTISDPTKELQIGLFPGMVNEDLEVEIQYLDPAAYRLPEGKTLVSDLFSFDLRREERSLFSKPFPLSLLFDDVSNAAKQLSYYDSNKQQWFPFPGMTVNQAKQSVSGMSIFPYAVVGVFVDANVREGVASWYRDSSKPDAASTNLYPIGTRLRVTHVLSGKATEVEVVSTWSKNNSRVIDLERSAFEKLAGLGSGVILVRIEPVK